MMKRSGAALLVVALLWPSAALAQASKAGVVTTLEGNVTARRVALPNAVPLKFKDDVFLQDTVTTGDKSLARMLLGGKAVVTVRERSVLTITETPGRSTLELETGKFALAVAREKMRPGDEIQIRTPNAIAGVRGTVVITEVNRQSAQAGGGAPAVLTNFYVLRGSIVAQQLDPGTRQPIGAPLQVGTLQGYSQAGSAAPSVAPVPPEQVGQITAGLQPSGNQRSGGDAGKEQVKAQAVETAVALLNTLTGSGTTQGALAITPATTSVATATTDTAPTTNVVIPDVSKKDEEATKTQIDALQQAIATLLDFFGSVTLVSGAPYKTFTGTTTETTTSALFTFNDAVVVQRGSSDFIQVASGADATLAGPLARLTSSTLATGGNFVDVLGTLTSTTTSPLVSLESSSAITAGASLFLLNGGTLTLAGALLKDTDGTLSASGDFLEMTSATLSSTTGDALLQLSGTAVDARSVLRMTNSTMTLAGPLSTMTDVTGADLVDSTSAPLFRLSNSSLTSTGTGALITFTSTEADSDSNFIRLSDRSVMTLSGPLFSGVDSDLGNGTAVNTAGFLGVLDSSKLVSTGSSALISISGGDYDGEGPLVSVRRSLSAGSPSMISLAGPLLSASNTRMSTTTRGFGDTFGTAGSCCSLVSVAQGATLKSTGSSALLAFSSTTAILSDSATGGSILNVVDTITGFPSSELVAPSTVSLAGPLLSASNSTLTPLFSALNVRRSSFTSTSSDALITLTSSTLAAGGTDISGAATSGRVVTVLSAESPFGTAASAASVSISGPLLSASASTVSGKDVVGVFGGASFSSSTTSSLVSLSGSSSLKLSTVGTGTSSAGNLLSIGGLGGSDGATFATMTLAGPLLSATSSTLNLTGSLLNVFEGGKVTETHATSPLLSISGGTHTLASDSGLSIIELRGRSTNTATETVSTSNLLSLDNSSSLTIGQDVPLKRNASGSGALVELSSATVTAQRGLYLDRAVLEASAPLLNLKSSTLTTKQDALTVDTHAKLSAVVGPLAKLDASTLNVTGHALRALTGSLVSVSGDLFSLSNGSILNIKDGGAIFVGGGSVVTVKGGLVSFGGSAGNQVNVSNTFTPNASCSTQCGSLSSYIRVQNGASSNNLSISANALKNTHLGSLNVTSGSAVILDGAGSKLIISGN